MSPLLWTSKSLDKLCAALKDMQHDVCPNVVAKLLRKLGYSLQSNRKTREGSTHPDRDARFTASTIKGKNTCRSTRPSSRSTRRRKSW